MYIHAKQKKNAKAIDIAGIIRDKIIESTRLFVLEKHMIPVITTNTI
jgi:hypothetical protein